MKKNKTHRTFVGLMDMIVFMCAASMIVIICVIVIGGITAEPEQTKQETEAEVEPIVINTVESGDDILLTVIRDNGDTIFQYEGDLNIWKGADGKAYGIIYLHEEVLQ